MSFILLQIRCSTISPHVHFTPKTEHEKTSKFHSASFDRCNYIINSRILRFTLIHTLWSKWQRHVKCNILAYMILSISPADFIYAAASESNRSISFLSISNCRRLLSRRYVTKSAVVLLTIFTSTSFVNFS